MTASHRRTAQFFIITTVLVSGGLIGIMNTLSSAEAIDYDNVLRKHEPDILQHVAHGVETSWWNDSWHYRKSLSVQEVNGEYLTNETVHAVLNIDAARVSNDCSDIRVIQHGVRMPWQNTTSCATTTGADPDAIVQHRMEEGGGQVINDSAYDSAGILGGTRAPEATDPSWVSGRPGTGLRFDGNDFVDVAESSTLRFDDALTVTAWIRPLQITGGNQQWIVEKNHDAFMSYIDDAGTLHFRLNTTAQFSPSTMSFTESVTVDQWHHIAMVYNGSHMRSYLDGQLTNSVAKTGDVVDPEGFFIGADVGGSDDYYHGVIDDIRIYNMTLPSSRIRGQAAGGIGLDLGVNLTPSEHTDDLYVYFGYEFARHPGYNASDLRDRPADPSLRAIGVTRTRDEIYQVMANGVGRVNQRIGADLSYTHRIEACDTLSMRSPETVLETRIC